MEKVYVAYYWSDLGDGGSFVKNLGVFKSKDKAIKRIKDKIIKDKMDFEEGNEIDDEYNSSYSWVFNGGEDNYVVDEATYEN